MQFIPEMPDEVQSPVPYFEDNQKTKIPGRATHKTVPELQGEIKTWLERLGASQIVFIPGQYQDERGRTRYGFQTQFWTGPVRGRIDCVALPMRNETPSMKQDALEQALFLLRDELQAAYYSQVHKPHSVPLIPYLIGSNGRTVTEELRATKQLPHLLPATTK